jgi:sigma-B regulation protein RsbU (phosphoserine phosphatase)
VAGSGTTIAEATKLTKYALNTSEVGEAAYTFLLNEKGQVILTTKPAPNPLKDETNTDFGTDYLHSDNPFIKELAERMINRENGLMEWGELEGAVVFVAYHPLSVVNWSLGIVVPVETVISPANQIQQDILSFTHDAIKRINFHIVRGFFFAGAVTVFVVFITIFLARWLSNSFTVPIIALSKGAKIISAGDVSYRFEIKTGDELELLADTFNQMIGSIKNITAERERSKTELTIATTIQENMLPWNFPPFPDHQEFDIYAEMHPAKEVGGDFYDFFLIDEHNLGVVIADVSGKGVPAALFMVITKTLIKDHAQMGKPLDEVFYVVNNQLCENNQANMFVTAFMGVLEIHTGKFRYVNAGHNPPLIRRGGEFTWLETKPGLVLAAMENIRFKVMETTLDAKDMVFLYTDGVTEAMNKEGELFSNQRLLEVLNRSKSHTPDIRDYIEDMLHETKEFVSSADQADDITMLILERKSSPMGNLA